MKHVLTLSLALIIGSAAHAARLEKDTSDYAAGISVVEKMEVLRDKAAGSVKVASLNNGPAANPVTLAVLIESDEQMGDNIAYDYFTIPGTFNDDAKSQINGDYLVIKTMQEIPDNGASGWKNVAKTLKIRIKENGKKLSAPEL